MSTTTSTPKIYVESVRGQYEMLPYPMRDVSDERRVLHTGDFVTLDALNHEAYGGKRDMRKGLRFLIAGQGTGDTAVFLAEQLRGHDAEIVTIDLSSTSIGICKQRLAQRGLTNVTLHHMSILDVTPEKLGMFDFIETGGVLHHLAEPQDGLNALASVLKDDGIMGIMVYAFYGRLAVYLLQSLFQHLIAPDAHPMVKIDIAREFLKTLPKTNCMTHAYAWSGADLQDETGSGLFDLLLHSTDRAYTVPQLYEWVGNAGLYMGNFCNEWEGNSAYTPEVYTRSPLLRALVADKPLPERQAIAEIMSGSITKHLFYVSKQPKVEAEFADDMVMVLSFRQHLFVDYFSTLVKELEAIAVGEQCERQEKSIKAPALVVTKTPHAIALLNLLPSPLSIGEIIQKVCAETGSPEEAVRKDFKQLYHELRSRQRAYLRHKDIPPYIQFEEMARRLKSFPPIPTAA